MSSEIGFTGSKINNAIASGLLVGTGYLSWVFAPGLKDSYGDRAPGVATTASMTMLAVGGWIAMQGVLIPLGSDFVKGTSERCEAVKKFTFNRNLTNLGVALWTLGCVSLTFTLWSLSTSSTLGMPALTAVGSAGAFAALGENWTYVRSGSGPVGSPTSVTAIDNDSMLHFDHKFVFRWTSDPNNKKLQTESMVYSSIGAAFEASKFEDDWRNQNHHLFQNKSAEDIRKLLVEWQGKPDVDKIGVLCTDWHSNNPGVDVLNKYLKHAIRYKFGFRVDEDKRSQEQKTARLALKKTGKSTLSHPDIAYPGAPSLSGQEISGIIEKVRGEIEAEDAKKSGHGKKSAFNLGKHKV